MFRTHPTIYRIVDSFFRYRWLFLISFFSVVIVAVVAFSLRPKTYVTTAATRIVSQETASVLGVAPGNGSYVSAAQQNVNHFRDLMQDDLPGGFIDTALHNAELARPISVTTGADSRYALLRKSVSADWISDTVFGIGITWDDPEDAVRIVRALQAQYVETVGLGEQAQSTATEKFLNSEIASYSVRLQKAEDALSDYKRLNMGRLPDAQTSAIQELSNLQTRLNDLRVTSQDNSLKRQALQNRLAQIKPMIVTEQLMRGDATTPQAPAETPAELKLKDLVSQRQSLLLRLTPEHPDIQALDSQIALLQSDINQERRHTGPRGTNISQSRLSQNPEYQDLMLQLTQANISEQAQQAQIKQVQQQIADYNARMQKMPAAERELNEKTRDYTVVKTQYENLLARREQARMKASLDKASAISTLTPIGSITPEATFGKKKLLMMALASSLVGLILGILLIVMREWLDPSLRYPDEAEKTLRLPVLTTVPSTTEIKPFTLKPASPIDGNGNSLPEHPALDGLEPGMLVRLDPSEQFGWLKPSRPTTVEVYTQRTLPQFSHLYAALEHEVAAISEDLLTNPKGDHAYVIGVTSAVAGEGKTTVALNLAINAARNSFKRVCLIDLSLAEENLGEHMGVLSRKKGIINILEATQSGDVSTLQLNDLDEFGPLANGKLPYDAARVARSPRILELLDAARKEFDLVIVDLPAVSTDNALPLTRHMDGLIAVACAGATPGDVVATTIDYLGRQKVVGVVLNQVKSSTPKWLRKRLLSN